MAKRLIGLMLTLMVGIFMTRAQESLLVYGGITPSAGSEISSFEFVLKFDLSKLIETSGEGYGVGWIGYHNDKRPAKEESVTIYKGDPSDGIVVGRCCDDYYNSEDPNFTASSEVYINIPGAIPEPGEKYTMVITNEFQVYKVGEYAIPVDNAEFNCFSNPLTYTFVGGTSSDEELAIVGTSIQNGQSIENLSYITFNFNQPITLTTNSSVEVKENDVVYATSINAVLSEDKTSVTYAFDNIPLYLNHSYIISLPIGAVSSAANTTETNKAFSISVAGNHVGLFMLKSSNPTSEERTVFSTIEGVFDMPDGLQIYKMPAYALNLNASLYKEEVAESNLVATLNGVYNNDKNGIIWSCSASLEPETKYVLYKPEREFRAYDPSTDKFSNEWYNGEVLIVLNTPSVEESGFPPMELGEPVIGKHDGGGEVLHNGDAVDYLDLIEIAPVEYFYKGKEGTNNFRLYHDTNKLTGYLYDITSGTPELIKEVSLSCVQRETTMFEYGVISVPLKSVFFEGHRYRFVIPQGEFTILYPLYFNYVRSPEYSIEFEGATPTEVELLGCTWQEGEERSSVGNVVWTFKGKFELNPEAQAQTLFAKSSGKYNWLLTSSVNASGNTQVVAHIYSSGTGEPLPLRSGDECTIILPEGAVYYPTDPDITNKEISITVKGMDVKQVDEPEFVNVEVCINGFHTSKFESVKGRKLTLNLVPDGNWTVTGLSRDGDDGIIDKFEDGVYTTPALSADTRIEATVEYAGVLINETATSVMEIPDMNVKVYSDGENIIVEGMNVGDMVAVYSVNGMLIAEREMTTADHNMQITIARGQVYIVRVNNQAVKIQH